MFRLDYLVIKNKGAFIRIERGGSFSPIRF